MTRARGRVSPSGQSSTARRCCSNWLVVAPSIDQWPELCGRIASSLTTRPFGASNSSTASTPTTPSSLAIVVADPLRLGGQRGRQPRRRRDDLDADPVALHRLDDRPAAHRARRRPGDLDRELVNDRDPLLEDQVDVGQRVAVLDEPHARDRRTRRVTAFATYGRGSSSGSSDHLGTGEPELGELRAASPACPARSAARRHRGTRSRRAATRSLISVCGTCSWSKVMTSQDLANRSSAAPSVGRRRSRRRA